MGGSEGKVFVKRRREWGRTLPRAVACQRMAMVSAAIVSGCVLETSRYYLFVPENSRL